MNMSNNMKKMRKKNSPSGIEHGIQHQMLAHLQVC